jgi:hypothetical protein
MKRPCDDFGENHDPGRTPNFPLDTSRTQRTRFDNNSPPQVSDPYFVGVQLLIAACYYTGFIQDPICATKPSYAQKLVTV